MGKFDKYKGLFAEQGGFDIPENYGVGVAWKAMPALTLAADIQRINYGDVASVGNTIDCLFAGACQLGANNGAGFGWQNTTVYKLGVSYEMSQSLTLRGGYATLKQPIPQSQTFINILAPGVVEQHLTLGGTWTLPNKSEVTVAYMHAMENKVNGSGSIPAALGGGEANLRMSEDSLGIGWGMRF
jgi:long-chain fatty acid transport protein